MLQQKKDELEAQLKEVWPVLKDQIFNFRKNNEI